MVDSATLDAANITRTPFWLSWTIKQLVYCTSIGSQCARSINLLVLSIARNHVYLDVNIVLWLVSDAISYYASKTV
jgi:hypothetical protein